MNEEEEGFRSLYSYLSILESELDFSIRQTMADVRKLQDIYETIKPVEDNTPKENKEITQLLNLANGITPNDKESEKPLPPDPYKEFQEALEAFNKIPGKKHKELSHDFISRLSDFTPKTEAHVLHKLVPCARALNHELDMILKYDMEQPSFCLRATYGTEKAVSVMKAFEKELENFQDMKKIDCPFKEKFQQEQKPKPKQRQISTQFETFANLKLKQLSSIFKKRGEARKTLITYRIREKLEEVLLPYLHSSNENIEEIQKLRTAAKYFPILANNPRAYSLICKEEPDI